MSQNTVSAAKSVSSAKSATPRKSTKSATPVVPVSTEEAVNIAFADFMATATGKSVVSEIVAMYVVADKSEKAVIRTSVEKIRDARIEEMDLVGAASAKMTRDALITPPASSATVVDYNIVVAHRIMSLRHAADAMLNGDTLPEGIKSDMLDFQVISDIVDNFDKSDTPDGFNTSVNALASAKITRSGTRRSIQGVLDKAFENVASGTFMTVSDIRHKGGTSDYTPSDGAIAARLFPRDGGDVTVTGVAPVDATATTARGARKI